METRFLAAMDPEEAEMAMLIELAGRAAAGSEVVRIMLLHGVLKAHEGQSARPG